MLSRPLIVGPLLGWCLGNGPLGFMAGATAELLWIQVTPAGIGPIDPTIIGALATVWTLLSDRRGRAALVVSLAAAIPCGLLMRPVDAWVRRHNDRLTAYALKGLSEGGERPWIRSMGLSLVFWFLKAGAAFVAFGVLGRFVVNAALSYGPPQVLEGLDFAGRLDRKSVV